MDKNVDGAIVILTPQATTDILETAAIVPRVAKDVHKPILASFMGLVDISEGVRYLENHGIPNYLFPEAAARTMADISAHGQRGTMKKGLKPGIQLRDRNKGRSTNGKKTQT